MFGTNDCCPHTHCRHLYASVSTIEPWTNPELATCNPHGSHNLTIVCSVTTVDQVPMQDAVVTLLYWKESFCESC